MKQRIDLRKSCAILLICALSSSCAKIKISDMEVCADGGSLGAFCFTTLSGKEREINKFQWDDERLGMLCMQAKDFGELKAAILKFCADKKSRCVMEAVEKVEEIADKADKVSKKVKR